MINLDSSTGVTLRYILRYLSLHSCPPKILLEIFVHLIGSWMDRIPQAMGLVHDLAVKLEVLWNHMADLEP
jgi:hypothetical protein